jgi:hypothetical protein
MTLRRFSSLRQRPDHAYLSTWVHWAAIAFENYCVMRNCLEDLA